MDIDPELLRGLVDDLKDDLAWAPGLGWLAWDGKVWNPVSDSEPTARANRWLEDNGHRPLSAGILSTHLRVVLEMDVETLDGHPHLLNVQNGVVNLRTGALHPHNPALRLTRIAAVDYDPGASHSAWDRALSTVRPGDLADLHVLAGQAATGFPGTKAVAIHGPARSGKTTLSDALAAALGTYAVMTGNPSDFREPPGTVVLRGARLALATEGPASAGDLEPLVGPQQITGRHIRRADVTFNASHTLITVLNQAPPEDGGTALLAPVWLRSLDEVGDADPDLHRSVVEPDALRAVLRWIVDGAVRWYAETREPVRV